MDEGQEGPQGLRCRLGKTTKKVILVFPTNEMNYIFTIEKKKKNTTQNLSKQKIS